MSRAWRVLDFTESAGHLSAVRGQVRFKGIDNAACDTPVADVAVLLLGDQVSVTPGALHHLAVNDVAVLPCDWRGVPYAGFYPWSTHTRVGARQLAQASVPRPRLKNAWMRIIRAKINGQAHTLNPTDPLGADHLRALAREVRSGDPKNLEAAAARWYWSRLFDGRYFSREQDGLDTTNTLLNYGYGVLRGLGIRSVQAAGLAPALGIFHYNRSNPFNLVEDLIEPFRPVVDACVASLSPFASLEEPAVKQMLVGAMRTRFSDFGVSAAAELTDLAQRFGRYVEGEDDKLIVRSWSGQPEADQDAEW